jgi:hypothetical protein
MPELLTLEAVAKLTSQPVRRLREWCATGQLHCEREGRQWMLPEEEVPRVAELIEARSRTAKERRSHAMVVPTPVDAAVLGAQIALRLKLPEAAIMLHRLALDGREYVIAAWPGQESALNRAGFERLAMLADELGGELLDGMNSGHRPPPSAQPAPELPGGAAATSGAAGPGKARASTE